jgi:hypothetical protein
MILHRFLADVTANAAAHAGFHASGVLLFYPFATAQASRNLPATPSNYFFSSTIDLPR